MRWRKLGRVFDPADHTLPNGCQHFAQSPQAIVFSDFVRVFFSTRAVDGPGKFLSYVAYVDMEKDFSRVRKVCDEPVMPLGQLGAFDEHGIFPLSPVQVGDAIYAYTTGWTRRVSVPVETAIGLAISYDGGQTFSRRGPGPVLAASLHEPFLVGDGFVRIVDDLFHMWYIFGTKWSSEGAVGAPERTYKIGHATSRDGVTWVKDEGRQIVPDKIGPQESQALPSVLYFGGKYRMMFCYRETFGFRTESGRGYRLGHAWSDDLVHWTRDDTELALEVTPNAWDSEMQCYPHLVRCDDKVYLLYNGNAFGRQGFGAAVLDA